MIVDCFQILRHSVPLDDKGGIPQDDKRGIPLDDKGRDSSDDKRGIPLDDKNGEDIYAKSVQECHKHSCTLY